MVEVQEGLIRIPPGKATTPRCQQAGMYWHGGLKSWIFPLTTRMAERITRLFWPAEIDPEAQGPLARAAGRYPGEEEILADLLRARDDDELLADLSAGLSWITPPYRHQRHATLFGLAFNRWAYFLGLGAGKTKVALDTFRLRKRMGGAQRCLVVAPPRLLWNWQREAARHCGVEALVLEGSRAQKILALRETTAEIVLANYELLVDRGGEIAPVVEGWMLVFDESIRLKNKQTKWHQAAVQLSWVAESVYLLCGEPYTRDLSDIFSQFLALDLGETFGSAYSRFFQQAFAGAAVTFDGKVDWTVNRAFVTNTRGSIARRSVRYETLDCVDLPERIFVDVPLTMTGDQLGVYRAVLKECKATFGDVVVIPEVEKLTQIIRLSQVTSGFYKDADGINQRLKENVKADCLRDLYSDALLGVESIVWCKFHEDLNIVREVLDRLGVTNVELSGRVGGDRKKQSAIDLFAASKVQVLIATPGTGGAGLTLNNAKAQVFYGIGYNLDSYLNALGRNYRIGQTDKVTVYHLVCRKSIDEDILENLKGKKEWSDVLLKRLVAP